MAAGEFWVYVVELDATDLATRGPKGAVYVGETGLTPEERFAKHKAGGKVAVRTCKSVVCGFDPAIRTCLVMQRCAPRQNGPRNFATADIGSLADKASRS